MTQRFKTAAGHFFDGEAALEQFVLFERARLGAFGFAELADKLGVGFLVERAVDKVRRFALFPAVHVEGVVKVDTVGLYHRGDGVEEMEALATQALEDIVGERVAGQRPRRDERGAVAFEARDLFAVERDIRALRNLLFYRFAEDVAVHGQGVACRHGCFAGGIQQETPEHREFLL